MSFARYDSEAIAREIRVAFGELFPEGTVRGRAPGAELEVDFTGAVTRLVIDPAAPDLGAAIVDAHRNARGALAAATRRIILGSDSRPRFADSPPVRVRRDGVTVVMGGNGFLERVEIATWARRRYRPDYLARLVLAAIRKAEA